MRRAFISILLLLLAQLASYSGQSQSTTIMSYGASWKYYDNGSNPGTGWMNSNFNDAAWASGAAFLGYGDTWITTCVNAGCGTTSCSPSCSNKYITTWFRKTLNIASLAGFDSIRFNAKRDDGMIVYLNGTEVWRDNLPATGVTDTTWASTIIDGVAETTAVSKTLPVSLFTAGNNTIAVELHQRGPTSSDLAWDMEVQGIGAAPAANIVRGPYLQIGNQIGVTVRWRTDVATKSRVQAGTAFGTYPVSVLDTANTTEHIVRINGLAMGTKYYYRIGTDSSFLQGDSSNFFTTAPADTDSRRIRIAAFGDCGRNDNNFQSGTLSAYRSYIAAKGIPAADVFLMLGDNAYNAGTDVEFQSNFFNAYSSNILKNHIMFPTPGNHDYANTVARQVDHNVPYYSIFSTPANGESGGIPSGTKAYYSYNWGNIHFLALDSYGMEDGGTTRLYDTTGAQVQWIKADLAANTKKWVIAYWHHPPYTMGSHNSDNESELVNIRQNFIRILERYGVDMIVCGHSHDYERSYLLKAHFGNEASFNVAAHAVDSSSAKYDGTANSCPYTTVSGKVNHGTVYVVAGSAGADGGIQTGYPHNALPFSQDDGGMLYFEVEGNRLDAKFIRRDNVIADQFTIMKDVNKKDTITIIKNTPMQLDASWIGAYTWDGGAATRTVSFAPSADTVITVKDSTGNTCLSDHYVIHVLNDTTTTPPPTTGVAAVNTLNDAAIYPVPTGDVLNLEFTTTAAGMYTYKIVDVQGRVLQTGSKTLTAGKQAEHIDVRNLPAQQVLILKVTAQKKEQSFRFTKD